MTYLKNLRKIPLKKGEIVGLHDGYKYFWPITYPYGGFSAKDLRDIADFLDDLNKDHDEIVEVA